MFPFALLALSFGGAIVPKINIIMSLFCERYFADQMVQDPLMHPVLPIVIGGDNAQCKIPEVEELVSSFMLMTSIIAGVLSAITAPILGAYSDRHGRRRVLAFIAVGSVLCDIVTVLVAQNSERVSVYWLLAASVIEGVTGSFVASMALVYAYASDCSPPQHRGVTFGYVQIALFTGIAFGPLIASHIVKATGDLLSVIYILMVAHSLFAVWCAFVLPESLTKERQLAAREEHEMERSKVAAAVPRPSSDTWRFLDPVLFVSRLLIRGDFFESLRALWPTGPGTSPALRRNLVILAGMDTMLFGVAMSIFSIIIIYTE